MSHTVVIRTTKSLEALQVHSKCHMPLGWSCLHPAMSFEDDLHIWDTVDWLLQFAFKGKSYLIWNSMGLFYRNLFCYFSALTLKMLVYVSIFNSFLESAGRLISSPPQRIFLWMSLWKSLLEVGTRAIFSWGHPDPGMGAGASLWDVPGGSDGKQSTCNASLCVCGALTHAGLASALQV